MQYRITFFTRETSSKEKVTSLDLQNNINFGSRYYTEVGLITPRPETRNMTSSLGQLFWFLLDVLYCMMASTCHRLIPLSIPLWTKMQVHLSLHMCTRTILTFPDNRYKSRN